MFVLVSVRNPKNRDEIFKAPENYGVQTCAYWDQALSTLEELAAGGVHSSDTPKFIFTEEQLCDLVDKANKVVIYGAGGMSDVLVNYLE